VDINKAKSVFSLKGSRSFQSVTLLSAIANGKLSAVGSPGEANESQSPAHPRPHSLRDGENGARWADRELAQSRAAIFRTGAIPWDIGFHGGRLGRFVLSARHEATGLRASMIFVTASQHSPKKGSQRCVRTQRRS
jgi:hypothetical protein